jgi:hypothetical protein
MESPSEPPLPLAAGRRMLLCSVRHAEAHCIRRRSAIHHHHCHCCRHSYRQTGRACLHRLWVAAHARAEPPNAPADSVSVRASVALSELGSAEAPAVLHPLRQHLQSAAALRRQFVRSSCGVRRQSARRHHLVGGHSGAHGSLDGPRASADPLQAQSGVLLVPIRVAGRHCSETRTARASARTHTHVCAPSDAVALPLVRAQRCVCVHESRVP